MAANRPTGVSKQKIYYARTYRYLHGSRVEKLLFLGILVLPCLILLLMFYGELSALLAVLVKQVLQAALPGVDVHVFRTEFIPMLDPLSAVAVPTVYPTIPFILMNLLVTGIVLFIVLAGKKKAGPVGIYLAIMIFIHVINLIFFLFATLYFPYTARDFGAIYMEQQMGIWVFFLVISGLITGLLGFRGLLVRIFTFFTVMMYSFVFGILRYILALYVVYRFSILYMAIFFFALGPFLDFLYLVSIYGFYVDHMITRYEGEQGMGEWLWS